MPLRGDARRNRRPKLRSRPVTDMEAATAPDPRWRPPTRGAHARLYEPEAEGEDVQNQDTQELTPATDERAQPEIEKVEAGRVPEKAIVPAPGATAAVDGASPAPAPQPTPEPVVEKPQPGRKS